MSPEKEEIVDGLIAKVFRFMENYVLLMDIKDKIKSKEMPDDQGLSEVFERLNILMQDIESFQETLGYQVGFPFETDTNFANFSISDGALSGDLSNVYLMITPWLKAYASKEDLSEAAFYKFFEAAFIMELSEYQYYSKQETMDSNEQQTEDPRQKPGFFARIALRFHKKKADKKAA